MKKTADSCTPIAFKLHSVSGVKIQNAPNIIWPEKTGNLYVSIGENRVVDRRFRITHVLYGNLSNASSGQ
jgi:hypothetical protein